MSRIIKTSLLSLLFLVSIVQADFPTKPIKIVVYTGPRGLINITARKFASIVDKYVDATFVVKNKPGAGGFVALKKVIHAPGDKDQWELDYYLPDDSIIQYSYTLTIVDSILSIPSLELINSYSIDVDEPSGLDLALDNMSLWTVSDKRSKIYQVDLTGQILQEISIPGIDLEGITLDVNGNSFWVVQESLGEILQVDTLGNELQRVTIPAVRDGSGGLEGITINSINNHLFLLKEKDPSVLIELDTNFKITLFKRISTAQDYSGMDYNELENEFWIVSDQDKMVYRYDLNGTVLNSYPINVEKAEGIAFDSANNLVYIVSDSADSLYVYRLN